MPIKKPTTEDKYLLCVFTVVTIVYLAFFMGLIGCTRAPAATAQEIGPSGLPLYSHVDPPRKGFTSECRLGGVAVYYKGNTTYVCYKKPRTAPDDVYIKELCPGEAGVCVNNALYAPRGNSDLLYEWTPGFYPRLTTGYSCSFNVKSGCEVTK